MNCDSVCLVEIGLLIFTTISTFVYIVFMVTVFKNRNDEQLGNSFFRIAFLLGFADLIYVWAGNLFFVIPEFLHVSNPKDFVGVAVQKLGFVLILFGRTGQILGVALLTINRLIVVLRPLTHELILTPKRTLIAMILLQVVLPLVFGFRNLLICKITKIPTANGSFIYNIDMPCIMSISIGNVLATFVTGVAVFVAYVVMLVKMVFFTPSVGANDHQARIQRNLTVSGSVVGGLLVASCISMAACPRDVNVRLWCNTVRHAANILFSMSNPYLFLFMSTAVREHFVFKPNFMACGSTIVTHVTAPQ